MTKTSLDTIYGEVSALVHACRSLDALERFKLHFLCALRMTTNSQWDIKTDSWVRVDTLRALAHTLFPRHAELLLRQCFAEFERTELVDSETH